MLGNDQICTRMWSLYLLSHLLGWRAAELLGRCTAALHHVAAAAAGVSQQMGVDGIC